MLWGLRTGCLLINDVLEQAGPSHLIYWQPTLVGDTALTQFLRLRTAGAVGNTDRSKETTKALLETLQGGTALEIAGLFACPDARHAAATSTPGRHSLCRKANCMAGGKHV